ncbi:G2/mitotic-specific cyclin S13-7 [Beta vulgaris subsp. vulgaris]|uniref:G2/mitotic-specific cyclin S13-7 n=1 Tax=Beta vulgaris subsp. vulgaris TaxID=3555 RepID=UPI0020368FD7|nr:G2/mitotic-specific cyclin S13-7 [Beta vulgaris subsp. vulgaris]
MDSRVVLPPHVPIKAPEEQKQKKEGGNRRPLQEIGNMVNFNNVPIIKSLGALSLVTDGAAEKKKEKNEEEELVRERVARAQKKVTCNPNPETVIIISSDEEEKADVEKYNKKKRILSGKRSSRKKKYSLTFVLTARSKAACGVATRPRDEVVNIDAADGENELAVAEYVEEIYKFYKIAEDEYRLCDYMPWQSHINEKMRMILIDWLVEVHNKFELLPETLYLTIDLVDRYLSTKVVSRKELQLIGISSMLLACKYEEIWAPEVQDFMSISDSAYTNEQILGMEKEILGKLEWNLTVATPYVFLVRFIKATVPSDKELENMAFYLAENGLMQYQIVKSFCPSLIAAAAVYAALYNMGRTPFWTETLQHYTGYSEEQLKDCAKMLIRFQMSVKETKLKGVHRKFSSIDRGAVALLPPAIHLKGPSD